MEENDNILAAIDEVCEYSDAGDVDMLDIEEGEVVEQKAPTELAQSCGGGDSGGNDGRQSKNRRRKANKKKNKRRGGATPPNVTDINRFVLDTCRHLKEKKSYMVYTAVGCLGVAALSNLVKEVDAIQSCGGQMTADGRRFRNGGGILWHIMKTREPMAYKEIMKKSKEFEKQFKQQNIKQSLEQKKEISPESCEGTPANIPDVSPPLHQNQLEQSSNQVQHRSVHDRMRVPVSYGDIVEDDPA